MNKRGFLTWMLICDLILIETCLLGCKELPNSERQEQVLQQTESLYRAYLQGDVSEARASLQRSAELLEDATFLEPRGRAHILSLEYYRLYLLEKRTGKTSAAEADLIKARYWHLRGVELLNVPSEKAVEKVTPFDATHIADYIDNIDRNHNDNKLPRYFQHGGP